MQCISTVMNASLPLGSVWSLPCSRLRKFWLLCMERTWALRSLPMAGGPEEQQVAESAVCSNSVCSQRQGWHGARSAICFLHTRFPFLPICSWRYVPPILICVSEMGSTRSCPRLNEGSPGARWQVARSTLVNDHEIVQEKILQINNTY